MAQFEAECTIPFSVETVFDFLSQPYRAHRLSPPNVEVNIVSAPERLELGSRIQLSIGDSLFAQSMLVEIVEFRPPDQFVEEQITGPFRRWRQVHRFEPAGGRGGSSGKGATRMIEIVEFEPPGGLLGFVLTEERVVRGLRESFDYRCGKLSEILAEGQ